MNEWLNYPPRCPCIRTFENSAKKGDCERDLVGSPIQLETLRSRPTYGIVRFTCDRILVLHFHQLDITSPDQNTYFTPQLKPL
jgi:hypothetical protein